MEMAIEVALLTGWTIADTYRDLTFPRYNEIQKFWLRWPPVVVSAAVFAGVAPKNESNEDGASSGPGSEVDESGMADLIAAFGAPQPLSKDLKP